MPWSSLLSRWSIVARLTFLSVLLLATLIGTNAWLGSRLSENTRALNESGRFIGAVTNAYAATTTFGDLKYWLTDLAVSLLMRSEQQAYAARDRLLTQLDALEPYDPDGVEQIRAELEGLMTQALHAVDAYTDEQRVVGNSLMASARTSIAAIDQRLAELVAGLEHRATENRTRALEGAERAVDLAIGLVVAAIVFGIALTFVLVRSITSPLRDLVGAMQGITAGRLDVAIPARRGDEIGAMAHTLSLFRDSLVERDRLAAERERAEAEVRRAQTQLTEAIESISEGFALYGPDDRLVLCNSRYQQLYAGLDVDIVPGARFVDVVGSAARRGLILSAQGRVDAWLAERVAQHRHPTGAYEQLRGNGQWLRISEYPTQDGGIVGVFADITELKQREEQLRAEQERTAAANRLIMESIQYASRIQTAVLPPEQAIGLAAREHFLIWQPRDVVGGDFFWYRQSGEQHLIVVGDCTGHGVPGAFMTLIVCGLLDRITRDCPDDPARVLGQLHRELQVMLGQTGCDGITDDGLEAGVCLVSPGARRLVFAGAHFSLWLGTDGGAREIRGDRPALGYKRFPADVRFTNVPLEFGNGQSFYMTTDGLIDQIGGSRRLPFGKRRLSRFVARHHHRPMPEQASILASMFAEHQGPEVRRDDVTVLGFAPLDAA